MRRGTLPDHRPAGTRPPVPLPHVPEGRRRPLRGARPGSARRFRLDAWHPRRLRQLLAEPPRLLRRLRHPADLPLRRRRYDLGDARQPRPPARRGAGEALRHRGPDRVARPYRRTPSRDHARFDVGGARRQICQSSASGSRHPAGLGAAPVNASSGTAALFDRPAWRAHRERAARQGAVDFLRAEVADRLLDRLDLVGREFPDALDLGAGDGGLARALAERPGTTSVVAAEPAAGFLAGIAGPRVAADPELVPFHDGNFDLIASVMALHWVADLPGALVQLRRALKPDGLLLAAMLGGQTLIELRTVLFEAELAEEGGVSPRVSPAIELGDAAGLLQRAGFALPVADSETITVGYPDMLALMRDLRGMGEANALAARRRGGWRRGTLVRAAALYAERFGDADGRIPATFEILFLCGWAPHPSQPKPLRRGSATNRLADALRPPQG